MRVPAVAGSREPRAAPAASPGSPCSGGPAPADERLKAPPGASVCRIVAKRGRVEEFFVPLPSAEPLRFSYAGAFEVHPRADSRLADLVVAGPVAFRGALELRELGLARPVDVNWALRAGTKARFAPSRIEGAAYRGTLALGEVSVENVAIPCDALALVEDDLQDPLSKVGGRRVRPASDTISLYARPGSAERVDATGLVVFTALRTEGKWTSVAASFDDGSALRGWAENDALEAVPAGDGGGGPGEGIALCGKGGCAGLGPGPFERGRATVPAGVSISASPGGEAWARVIDDITVEALREPPGSEWIRLIALPGMEENGCAIVRHAYAPAAQVRFIKGE